jgi:hypothetical protein
MNSVITDLAKNGHIDVEEVDVTGWLLDKCLRKLLQQTCLYSLVLMHIAPELLAERRNRNIACSATPTGDIFALSCVIYETLFRLPLVDAETLHERPSWNLENNSK